MVKEAGGWHQGLEVEGRVLKITRWSIMKVFVAWVGVCGPYHHVNPGVVCPSCLSKERALCDSIKSRKEAWEADDRQMCEDTSWAD